ncbi:hypothetical protein [Pelobacter propionicus]|nr:hypothetical protein [Pelobacter propionicus]
MKSTKPVLGLILVFILGAGSGSLTTYLLSRTHFETSLRAPRHNKEEMLVKRLSTELSLDNQQQAQVKVIIHETHEKIRLVRRSVRPAIEAQLTESQQRIGKLLRPDQQQAFDKILAERETRRHRNQR